MLGDPRDRSCSLVWLRVHMIFVTADVVPIARRKTFIYSVAADHRPV